MTGLGGCVRGPLVAAALAVLCGPAPAQVQLQLRIEGQAAVEMPGNPVHLPAGEPLLDVDPWWIEAAGLEPGPSEPAAPPAGGQAPGRQPPQLRVAQLRRNRSEAALRRELSRVRGACPELDPRSRAAVMAAGREFVAAEAAGRPPAAGGIETILEQALAEAAGPPAAAAYATDLAGRTARRKATVIAVLVEAIDRDALLGDGQRAALAAMLRERWRPEWEAVAATALRNRISAARLPPGVAAAVDAALDPETVAAWQARVAEATR